MVKAVCPIPTTVYRYHLVACDEVATLCNSPQATRLVAEFRTLLGSLATSWSLEKRCAARGQVRQPGGYTRQLVACQASCNRAILALSYVTTSSCQTEVVIQVAVVSHHSDKSLDLMPLKPSLLCGLLIGGRLQVEWSHSHYTHDTCAVYIELSMCHILSTLKKVVITSLIQGRI